MSETTTHSTIDAEFQKTLLDKKQYAHHQLLQNIRTKMLIICHHNKLINYLVPQIVMIS